MSVTPFYEDSAVQLYLSDCLDLLASLPESSIDACVTDPPYGIGFMGKEWDTFKPGYRQDNWDYAKDAKGSPALHAGNYDYSAKGLRAFQAWTEQWGREVFRVLKPGAHIVVCGAPRAYHRMAAGIEDAGFEIRDCFAWLFGSGFPKSLNLGEGLGTALKPAHEPIVLARKPFKGSVKGNVEKFGTGALNIDACRIDGVTPVMKTLDQEYRPGFLRSQGRTQTGEVTDVGRWPANVVLDDLAAMVLDEQSGNLAPATSRTDADSRNEYFARGGNAGTVYDDGGGGASRFYYVAKPSREERDYGTEGLTARQRDDSRKDGHPGGDNPRNRGLQKRGNFHPTVKPVELMRWLVRLVTPPNGTVLDPFLGSGTTGMACRYEQRQFIGIEREAEYIAIAERRILAVCPLFAEHSA